MGSPNYVSKLVSLPRELFAPQPSKRGLIFETCCFCSILGDPVPRGVAVAKVFFLQFTIFGDTVNLPGKFDASSAKVF